MTQNKGKGKTGLSKTTKSQGSVLYDISLLTDDDVYLFNEGSHYRLYEKLGAHPVQKEDLEGTCFGVWAPDAEQVCVMGAVNSWDKDTHALRPKGNSGIWEGFIPFFPALFRYRQFWQKRQSKEQAS